MKKVVTTRDKVIHILKNYLQIVSKRDICKITLDFYYKELEKVKQGKGTIVEYEDIKTSIQIFEYMRISSVEKEIFKNEKVKYADKKNLEEKIENKKSELCYYEMLIDLIHNAVRSMKQEQKYLIEMFYFSEISYKWQDVEENYNKKFKCNLERKTLDNYKNTAITNLTNTIGENDLIKIFFF